MIEQATREQLEEIVAAANAAARLKHGDQAPHFFINDAGVVDMVNADGSPIVEEDAPIPDDACGVNDGTACEATATHVVSTSTFSGRACAAHVEFIKERLGPDVVVQPIARA